VVMLHQTMLDEHMLPGDDARRTLLDHPRRARCTTVY